MKPELERIYQETLENEPRSKLDPYCELILRWRRQGKSYRTIIKLLADKCSLKTGKTPLMRFVKSRSRPRKPQPAMEAEQLPVAVPATPIQPASIPSQTPGIHTKLSPEEAARRRELLQSLRNKPALEPKPAVLEEFHYDEDKPLTIDRTIKD